MITNGAFTRRKLASLLLVFRLRYSCPLSVFRTVNPASFCHKGESQVNETPIWRCFAANVITNETLEILGWSVQFSSG